MLAGLSAGATLAPSVSAQQLPERRVASASELNCLLRSDFAGRVIVPRNVSWAMVGDDDCNPATPNDKPLIDIPLKNGVQLVGERGDLGRRPFLYDNLDESHSMFVVEGTAVRVEGLNLRGPKPGTGRKNDEIPNQAILVHHDPRHADPAQRFRQVVIADNELQQWAVAGVRVGSWVNQDDPSAYRRKCPGGCQHLNRTAARTVRVERNYIHHNAMDTKGYGVVVGGGAYASIEGNVFDANRHAIAASGAAYSGYIARFNYILEGGYKEDGYYNQHFDVHGVGKGGYGGSAGEYYEISHNTIRGEQAYRCFAVCLASRPAFLLRGKPTQGAHFRSNVVVQDDLDDAVALKSGGLVNKIGRGEDHDKFNFHHGGNRFDGDYSGELAAGDFDGDGRDDVFLANGTGWFFSRAGIRPWEFLRPSNKRVGDLGFADIDNDRRTDVLYRDGSGRVGFVKSGSAPAVTPLTSSTDPLREMRFGDFDGDGLTDMFEVRGKQWAVWYGRTRAWTATQSSDTPVDELLLGEFDAVRGTDVAAVKKGGWALSSGSRGGFTRFNGKLSRSFKDAVAADFDGNGRSDIAISDGKRWNRSADGRARLELLRTGSGSIRKVQIGRFDGTRSQAITFNSGGLRLVIWRGLATGSRLLTRSDQNMR